MGEFEEQWLLIKDSLLVANDDIVFYDDAQFGTSDDPAPHAAATYSSGPHDATHIDWSDTAIDHISETFEFFDLQNAASNPAHLHPSSPVQHVHSASASVTLYSHSAQHATQTETRGSEDAEFSAVAQPILQIPFSEDMSNVEDDMHPIGAFTPSPSRVAISQRSKGTKRQFRSEFMEVYHAESDVPSDSLKRRKKLTPEQLEGFRAVRANGACLRCYVQKLKCSEGRPCNRCQTLFEKARNTKALRWTACVSSSLSDLNIFALGVSVLGNDMRHPSGKCTQQRLDPTTAFSLYTSLFEHGLFSDAIVPLDDLYTKILQHSYGDRASEVHPFILKERNPLYRLVQLNVILLGSPIIAPELIGRVKYLQRLRAICAVVAFECLERALDRTNLATSNRTRQSALVVQAALLLDQVVQTRGDLPAAAISCARGEMFEEMRRHLIQFLSCYIQRLSPNSRSTLSYCLQGVEYRGYLREIFWVTLSKSMPGLTLHGPPALRKYAEMNWSYCGVESGEALHEYFSSHCSISCN